MKIIYWTELFLPDINGVSVFSKYLLPELQKRGHKFIVITSHGRHDVPNREIINNIPIYRFDFQKYLLDGDVNKIKSSIDEINHILKSFNPELVHLHSNEPSLFYYWYSKLRRIPTVLNIHLFIDGIHDKEGLFKKVLFNADKVVTVAKSTYETILKIHPNISNKIIKISHSLKTPNIIPQVIDSKQNNILYVGRLSKEKGIDVGIKAFSIVIKTLKDTKLIIAGSGPEENDLKKLVHELDIQKSVEFIGEIEPDSIHEIINNAYLVIVPSIESEQGPLICLEAGLMKRPVIASNIPGPNEIIQNNITGILVERKNPNDLAKKILFLLNNKKTAISLGKSARKHILKKYNFTKMIDNYDKIYNNFKNQN